MSREIRITVDDDEVFERMKRRKTELDLSWEEVLHRGLRPDRGEARRADRTSGHHPGEGSGGPDPHRRHRGGAHDPHGPFGPHGPHGPHGPEPHHEEHDRWDAFGDSLERQIKDRVYDSLKASFGAAGVDVPDRPGMDAEMEELASAEDATLVFEFLPADRAYEVPLRVDMETGLDGVTVDVVAVREGKSVRDANRFDTDARKRVNTRLGTGGTATLRFAEGAESYPVRPVLSWGRDAEGHPRVKAVDVAEVLLDADE